MPGRGLPDAACCVSPKTLIYCFQSFGGIGMDKKPYSNSFHTLEAVWRVLRRYSSRQHPLTVREIHEYLRRLESEPPSLSTLERSLRDGTELMELLFPGRAIPAIGGGQAVTAYQEDDTIHVVVETSEGEPLSEDASAVEASGPPFRAPSYSAVDKLLKMGIPFDLDTFPYRLRCVARVPGDDGRPKIIPYDEWEECLERRGETRNNVPRCYYLSSALTDGEWRMFADLVRVYPYISERQTQKFLRVLNRLNPNTSANTPNRYAFKRGSADRMRIIGKLDRAVAEQRKVRVSYGEYRLVYRDGIWTPELAPREQNSRWELEPYALMWANGNYYLVAKDRGILNLRADRILNVELLDEKFNIPEDFDPVRHRDSSPVMYPGEKTFVRLRCRMAMLNVLVDFFGNMAHYSAPREDGTVEVTMSIAPRGLKLFALQYLDSVEVLEPEALRQELLEALRGGVEKYGPGPEGLTSL